MKERITDQHYWELDKSKKRFYEKIPDIYGGGYMRKDHIYPPYDTGIEPSELLEDEFVKRLESNL